MDSGCHGIISIAAQNYHCITQTRGANEAILLMTNLAKSVILSLIYHNVYMFPNVSWHLQLKFSLDSMWLLC